jgi:hypothetical protein
VLKKVVTVLGRSDFMACIIAIIEMPNTDIRVNLILESIINRVNKKVLAEAMM